MECRKAQTFTRWFRSVEGEESEKFPFILISSSRRRSFCVHNFLITVKRGTLRCKSLHPPFRHPSLHEPQKDEKSSELSGFYGVFFTPASPLDKLKSMKFLRETSFIICREWTINIFYFFGFRLVSKFYSWGYHYDLGVLPFWNNFPERR